MEATAFGLGEDKDNTLRVAVKMLKGELIFRHLKRRNDKNRFVLNISFFWFSC